MLVFLRKKHPSVRWLRLEKNRGRIPGFLRTLAHREFPSCYVEQTALRSQQIGITNSTEIQSYSKDYLSDVLFSPAVVQDLFPDNVILVEAVFFMEPLPSNIDYLIQENGDSLCFAVEKCPDDALPRSISFGVLSKRVKFMHWSAIIYSSDPVLYEAHLVHQFKRACKLTKGDFMFQAYFHQGLTNCGKRVLKELLKIKLDEAITQDFANLYQAQLPVHYN